MLWYLSLLIRYKVGLPQHIAMLYFIVHLVGQLARRLSRPQHPDFIISNYCVRFCAFVHQFFFSKIIISACKEVVEAKSQSVSLERAKSLNNIYCSEVSRQRERDY